MSASSYEPALLEPRAAETLSLSAQSKRAATRYLLSSLVTREVDPATLAASISMLGTIWVRQQGLAALLWAAGDGSN